MKILKDKYMKFNFFLISAMQIAGVVVVSGLLDKNHYSSQAIIAYVFSFYWLVMCIYFYYLYEAMKKFSANILHELSKEKTLLEQSSSKFLKTLSSNISETTTWK